MDFFDKVSNFFDDLFLDDRRNATEADRVRLERARVENSIALTREQMKAERERNLFKLFQIAAIMLVVYAIITRKK